MTALVATTSSEIHTLRQLNAERDRYLSFLRRRIDGTTAEDILQSALLKVAERGIAPRDDARLSAWFYSVLRNAATDYLRHRARGARVSAALLVEPPPADHDAPNERLEVTRSLVSQLSESDRDTLETVYSEGGSIAQLAAKLSITPNAARVRVHRARAALAKLVEGSCPPSSPCASATRYSARRRPRLCGERVRARS